MVLFLTLLMGLFSKVSASDIQEKALINDIRVIHANVTGTVTDVNGDPLPGVNVIEQGTRIGTITDIDGRFSINVDNDAVLVFSFIGFISQEINVDGRSTINVVMSEDIQSLEEVVIVGYGQQTKQSLVGAIEQVDNEELKKTLGTSNLAQALTGRLPGVTTILSTGEPGNDDPKIFIRGQSTWNNAQPLILVDGIERKMNDIDVNEVESISVLKDASATAVFGVKGAEGVILITTKRGKEGKAKLSFSLNTGVKLLSKVPDMMSSFDGLSYRNNSIEYELPVIDAGWNSYTPMTLLNRYKHPQKPGDEYIFPDVDWADAMTRDYGLTTQANINISGGTGFANYFSSLSFISDGDILASGLENNAGYKSDWRYDRFNYRINLDLNLTPTTVLSTNIAGYVGTKHESYFDEMSHGMLFSAFYSLAPSSFPVQHENGMWGYTPHANVSNPVQGISTHGLEKQIRSQVMTDFKLTQQLDFITEGLEFSGSYSYDNYFQSSGGIFEIGNGMNKYIDPNIINVPPGGDVSEYIREVPILGQFGFDWVQQPPVYQAEGIRVSDFWNEINNLQSIQRRTYYQFGLNYAREFGLHNVTGTALMNREQYAQGSMFPTYREDWVGRVTYNFDDRYLFETNGAYNGSEKFGKGYRFGFFPSLAVGWIASNEKFMDFQWLSNLKFRYSIGKVGNDSFSSPRFAYETIWNIYGDTPNFGYPQGYGSTYPQYGEQVLGNPDLHWEVSQKQNLGIELSVLKNMFNLNVDIFKDDRNDIFMSSGQRQIPAYFGMSPVAANLGKTKSNGYEISFTFRNTYKDDLYYWFNWNYTHAKDKILFMEDPELLPAYQKRAGFQIGQNRTILDHGFLNNWDDVYSSPFLSTDNHYKLPGDLRMVDFNGDGQIDTYDNVPYGYPERPQNTYNFSLGADYKNFSAQLQFYGVYNISRYQTNVTPFSDRLEQLSFEYHSDYWSMDNLDANLPIHRFRSTSPLGSKYLFDGSYFRLKTAEIAYTFDKRTLGNLFESVRIYLNGNNIFFWTDMLDDREDNSGRLLYPTMKRFTMGLDIQF